MSDFPSHARILIIGGGVIGTSIAYHLGKIGMRERSPAGAGQADLGHHLARGGADRLGGHVVRDADLDRAIHPPALR